MQLLAIGRGLGFHHRINRFSHVVLFGDYEKRVAMWKPPEQTKDKERKHRTTCHTVSVSDRISDLVSSWKSGRRIVTRPTLEVYPYKKCLEAVAAYERQVNLRSLVMAPSIQGGLFLVSSYFSSILYPVGSQLLSTQFWEGQFHEFQPTVLLDTFSNAFFDASTGGVIYLTVPLCFFLSMRANFGTVFSICNEIFTSET